MKNMINHSELNPIVSIIVPILNEEEHLLGLLESISMQTYRPIEVKFVDGGSTDKTRTLLNNYIEAFSDPSLLLTLIFEEKFCGNKGPAHARNIGIKSAVGEFFILLDADTQFIDQDSVSKLKKLLDLYDFIRVKTIVKPDTDLEKKISITSPNYCHCGYRKWVFDNILFDEQLVYGEDRDLWFRIEKDLDVSPYTSEEILLVRHLPHSLKDYFKQSIWYAKSYTQFVNSVLEKGNMAYLDEIVNTFLGFLLCCYLPLFFITSFFKDFKQNKKIDFHFFSINFMRRCLFLFHLWKSSFNIQSLKVYVNCMALRLINTIDKF